MTILRCWINEKHCEVISTDTFVDSEGYVHIPADYDSESEYFHDLMNCTPDDASWEELDGQHIGNQIIRFI